MTSSDERLDEVVAVGAGPVGLTFAANLVRRGVPVTVLEAEAEPNTDWRASTFHPPTLEMLEVLDIVEEMVERGLVAPTYQLRDRTHGLIAEFDLTELKADTPYPFRLQLEQYKYSEILLRLLSANPLATVVRGEKVTGVSADGDRMTLTSTGLSGEARERQARYVIGSDGAKSTVRRSIGLDLEGHTYPVRFLILSTDYPFDEWFPDLALVNYFWDPREPAMVLRTPDVWRVMFSVPDEVVGEDLLDPESIQERLRGLTGVAAPTRIPVTSAQYYSVHQRVASTFRTGRVFLIGDAGHINSPVGGLGLNSGIHDALELSDALADVLSGERAADVLDQIAQRRRRIALDTVRAVTDRNTRQMTESDENARERNIRMMRGIAADEDKRRAWLLETSMIQSVRDLAKDG